MSQLLSFIILRVSGHSHRRAVTMSRCDPAGDYYALLVVVLICISLMLDSINELFF